MCDRQQLAQALSELRVPGVGFIVSVLALALLGMGFTTPAFADGGILFTDVAADRGIEYRRVPSASNAIFDALKQEPFYTLGDLPFTPVRPRGQPGVAVLDFDGDGDQDLYVTNGPGRGNSLYSNQLMESGETTFIDVADSAGVAAVAVDSTGVCYGDIDNDGDEDLYVLVKNADNLLFENQGDGSFLDISAVSGAGGGPRASIACSMGDVDGDGLLDIFVGNAYTDLTHQFPYFVERLPFNEHDQLFVSNGGNTFTDASASSGILDVFGFPPGAATVTLAVALVDLDQDGDTDIVTANDQMMAPAKYGGFDTGYNRLLRNDGTGRFTDATGEVGLDAFGNWMGLAFGDLDCDGTLDLFSTNVGDYLGAQLAFFLQIPYEPGDRSSRWFLGRPDGTFRDPGVGELRATPFGWGTAITDYDNDGDLDIIFHGGTDLSLLVDATNPGVVLQNQGCSARFIWDAEALGSEVRHSRRNVQGMAIGDLDGNGFSDVVSVSNFDTPEPVPLAPFPFSFSSPFDVVGLLVPTFFPTEDPSRFVFSGFPLADGSLAVELSSGNDNNWIQVELLGTTGLTSRGRVNRDGFGAVVRVDPIGERPVTRPVMGGSSHMSQNSRILGFGLGQSDSAVVEVLWPGGVRNHLFGVRPGERIVFPEIPCRTDDGGSREEYVSCVTEVLVDLVRAELLSGAEAARFLMSALQSWHRAGWTTGGGGGP